MNCILQKGEIYVMWTISQLKKQQSKKKNQRKDQDDLKYIWVYIPSLLLENGCALK